MITSGSLRDTLNPGTSRPGAAVPRLGLGVLVSRRSAWGASLGPLREKGILQGAESAGVPQPLPARFVQAIAGGAGQAYGPGRHDGQPEMSARRAIGDGCGEDDER